jgi:hypothetical protein
MLRRSAGRKLSVTLLGAGLLAACAGEKPAPLPKPSPEPIVSTPWPASLTASQKNILQRAASQGISVRSAALNPASSEPALTALDFITNIAQARGLGSVPRSDILALTSPGLGASLVRELTLYQQGYEYYEGKIGIRISRVVVKDNLAIVETCEDRQAYWLSFSRKEDPKPGTLRKNSDSDKFTLHSYEFRLVKEESGWLIVGYARTDARERCLPPGS